ncbi:MAG: uroporphyrinogen-III synthase [Cystobacterineae bacterium]|nr:uroporphyrinogen-III synthase [Cystobacterineae bacterium]
MAEELPWLIGRDLEDSQALAQRLRALGHTAKAFPCIARRALPFVLPETEAHVSILITSVFGAQCLLSVWPQCLKRWPTLSVVALAPKTSAWLKAKGVPVAVEVPGGARHMARHMANALSAQNPRDELVWLSSDAGAAGEEQAAAMQKLRALTKVHRVLAYSTVRAPSLEQHMAQWHGQKACLLLCSPSACAAFFEVRAAFEKSPVVVEVACVGNSTLRAWEGNKEAGEPSPSLWTHIDAFVEGTFMKEALHLAPTALGASR